MLDVRDLLGTPFVCRGRDPLVGLDCWGLVLEVGRRLNKRFPDFYISAYDSVRIGAAKDIGESQWGKAPGPAEGVVVGFRNDRGRHPNVTQHFGVCLDNARFIHTLDKTGVIITRLDHRYFGAIISGYYTWLM